MADGVPFDASERKPPPGAEDLGPVDPAAPAAVTVVVRRRPGAPAPRTSGAPLSREAFARDQGADAADIDAVIAFARANGLTVQAHDAARRTVALSGTLGELAKAFGVVLTRYRAGTDEFHGRTGKLSLPANLVPIVEGVFGLDDRPQTRTHFRVAGAHRTSGNQLPATSFRPDEVARLYSFPRDVDGRGECIAILEFGGGYARTDVEAYFRGLGITPPKLVDVGVLGASNRPTGDPNGPDGEVVLDVEVAGAAAPGAKLAMYFAPNTERGFIEAVTTAVHDHINRPSVISISWGQAEEGWTRQALTLLDAAFQDAATLGVTVCVASGDDGSGDRVGDGLAHVDFPASSPFALACGGTRLVAGGGRIAEETVWNDPGGGSSGGGVSAHFDPPAYQHAAKVPPSANPGGRRGRGVPDVAGNADPQTGYAIRVDGTPSVVGGTSAVAPLWAALVALLNQSLGHPVGLLQPHLYGPPAASGLRDITSGDNGAYSARVGWDACTGLGSPDGDALLAGLSPTTSGARRTR